jgi:hypothetical protein
MATSNTVNFRLDVEQIITEAYERCGIDNQTRTGYQAVSARRSLNLLFSEWANRGINYWAVQNNTLTLVDGQTTPYTLPEGTIDLIDVVIRETPSLYVWQIPDSSSYSLVYWSINQLEDVNASNQEADVPYRWSDCICAGLASKLAMKFAPDRFQLLDQVYEKSFDLASMTDNDGVTMRLRPTGMSLY